MQDHQPVTPNPRARAHARPHRDFRRDTFFWKATPPLTMFRKLSEAQIRQVKRRRKTAALHFCTEYPKSGCKADFTTKYRLKSKLFFHLILLSSALFLKLLISQSAGHVKARHEGIRNNVCPWCGYATANESDLVRHSKVHPDRPDPAGRNSTWRYFIASMVFLFFLFSLPYPLSATPMARAQLSTNQALLLFACQWCMFLRGTFS